MSLWFSLVISSPVSTSTSGGTTFVDVRGELLL